MKKIIFLFVTFILTFATFSVFASSSGNLYHSNDHGFSVSFPTEPDVIRANFKFEGIDVAATSYQLVDNDAIYYVSINNFTQAFNTEKSREEYMNNFLKGVTLSLNEVSILYNKDVVFKGFKAKSYKFKFKYEGTNLVQKGFYFFRNGTEHIKISIAYPEEKDRIIDEIYIEFVNSLQLSLTKTHNFTSSNFSINIPYDWDKIIPKNKEVLAAFGHQGYGENVIIMTKSIPKNMTVSDMSWEEILYPSFNTVEIQNQGFGAVGDVKTKYCIYIPKQRTEKYNLKYLWYVIARKSWLYFLIFTDREQNFEMNYPTFQQIAESIRFHN